ncbi:hypothetical protein Q1695_008263 [Nippostrongylus brasiliensis]|nr:hypothetical protein Q1695_008263 [Nippostrongylus brasiliensis]
MLSRRMASVVLLIGGCTEREEGGALRSIEELSFRHTAAGMNVGSRTVGDLQEARRSPSVFSECDGFLVVGGCEKKGRHLSSAERFQWSPESSVRNGILFQNVIEATSCAVSFALDDCRGVLLGGFNGNDCLKEVQLVELNGSEVAARRLPDIPFRLKNSVAVKLPDLSVLLFGGWDESQTMKTVFRLAFDEAVTSHDLKMEAVLPYSIEGHSCALHNDHIFVIGGYDGISVVDTIVRYSISDRSCEVVPTRLAVARENHVCEVILDRYVVVMAGWNGREALDSIELFEIVDESPYLIPVIVDCKLSKARIRPVSIASQ